MQIVFQSFFSSRRASWMAGAAVAAMLVAGPVAVAQTAPANVPPPTAQDLSITNTPATSSKTTAKGKKAKNNIRVSKDTKKADKVENKYGAQVTKDSQVAKDAQLPDKQLYDKALAQKKSGHFDVARLDLQTLLNTYPDSQYLMKAKLAVADCWYSEGGTAALAQAEQEYTDFITFFPNAPEAAEAQMRVGDIYFKQMDVPDRDFTKGTKAEEAYRTMLKQYPDAPPVLLKQGQQKLREVQELLGERELQLGQFYASHENWPASIARYQTIVNTFPQFSHMDDALIGVGDGYEAEAKIVRLQTNMPEGPKALLLEEYDGKAAAAYRRVVLEHSAAPHVEDAKERLAEMNVSIPTPTADQMAASEALEGSRAQYTIAKRLEVLFLHKPDVVIAATAGEPPLEDPPVTTAPGVLHGIEGDYKDAFDPKGAATRRAAAEAAIAAGGNTPDTGETPAVAAPVASAPLAFQEVPTAGSGNTTGSPTTLDNAPADSGSTGTGVGVEIVQPKPATSTPASTLPSASGAQDPNNGLTAVGPKDNTPLPAAEPAAPAPDQVNEVSGQAQPAVAPGTKPVNDKADESSSKHKPKKGIDKLNPF